MLLLLLRKEGLLEGPRSRIDWPKLLLLFVIVSSVHMFSSHVPAKCKANSNQRCLLKKTMEKLRKCYYAMVPLRMLEQEVCHEESLAEKKSNSGTGANSFGTRPVCILCYARGEIFPAPLQPLPTAAAP